jgi:FkbM family methyltransferase
MISDTNVQQCHADSSDPATLGRFLPWWLNGCNTAHEPHREAIGVLKSRGLEFLMETTNVKSTSYLKLLETYDVKNVSIVKLDMEGYEFPVLEELACKTTRGCPSSIMFETKHMKYRDASRFSKILSSVREMFDCNASKSKLNSQMNDKSDKVCHRKD